MTKNMIDTKNIDLEKEIKNLKKLPGKERGVGLKYLINYLKDQKGEKSLKKIEDELLKYGYKLPNINKIDDMDWIPSSLTVIYFLAVVKVFQLQEEDIIEIGKDVALSPSTLVKFYIKYFSSTENTIKKAISNWKKLYTHGRLELKELDEEKKIIRIRIKDFNRHPFACLYDRGVFFKIAEIATGWKKIKVEETKCFFRGDKYHEFVVTGK